MMDSPQSGLASERAAELLSRTWQDGVRSRPHLYVGSGGDKGLHQMLWCFIGGALDRFAAGRLDHLYVNIHRDGSVSLTGSGTSISEDILKEDAESLLRMVSTLSAPGLSEYSHIASPWYRSMGQFWGGDLAALNALSRHLTIAVRSGGARWRRAVYTLGRLEHDSTVDQGEVVGDFSLRFWPDVAALGATAFDYERIRDQLEVICYLNPPLKIHLSDERSDWPCEDEIVEPDGLVAYVEELNRSRIELHPVIHFVSLQETTRVEVALQYSRARSSIFLAYMNNDPIEALELAHAVEEMLIQICDGQSYHALTEAQEQVGKEPLLGPSARGLTCVVSVHVVWPPPISAMRSRGWPPDVHGPVVRALLEGLSNHFRTDPKDFNPICRHLRQQGRTNL